MNIKEKTQFFNNSYFLILIFLDSSPLVSCPPRFQRYGQAPPIPGLGNPLFFPSGYRDGRHPACTLDECALRRDEKRGLCKFLPVALILSIVLWSQSPLKNGASARMYRLFLDTIHGKLMSQSPLKNGASARAPP